MIKRLPWLRRLKKTDPEPPLRLPIAESVGANARLIRKLVFEKAEEVSRREGIDRREFMASACGMATTLYMINLVNGCGRSHGESAGPMAGSGSPAAGMQSEGGAGSIARAGSGPSAGTPGLDPGVRDGGPERVDAGPHSAGAAGYPAHPDAMVDPEVASCLTESRGELIIDIHTHMIAILPNGPFADLASLREVLPTVERYPWLALPVGCEVDLTCYYRGPYIEQFLLGSDTSLGVVSGLPYTLGPDGMGYGGSAHPFLLNEDAVGETMYIDHMFPGRVLGHGMVMPNDRLDVQLVMMERIAGWFDHWVTCPSWVPQSGSGYFLDDDAGQQMIQKGLDLGMPTFCVWKGMPQPGHSAMHAGPRDIGPAANLFPQANLVVYHSAFEHGLEPGQSSLPGLEDPDADLGWGAGVGMWPEGPYDENDAAVQELYPLDRGVNSLIKSLRDNNIGPNGSRLSGTDGPTTHVYAECGAVWANLFTRPIEAQHYFGKLLKHIGEDRILWGTSCLWYGSPQPLIAAFRALEISQEFQDRFGYPALTSQRKAKILGRNAARLLSAGKANIDPLACHDDFVGATAMRQRRELDAEWGPRRDMIVRAPALRTRRDLLSLASWPRRQG